MAGFALRAVGPRQHLRCPTCGRDALQPRRRVARREDDRFVTGPRPAARGAVEMIGTDRDRRAAGYGDLPEDAADAVAEGDPLAIRRDEGPTELALAARDRYGFERIERTDEELRPVVADVDDVRTVLGDREIALHVGDRQRRPAGVGDGRARHARRHWTRREPDHTPGHDRTRD